MLPIMRVLPRGEKQSSQTRGATQNSGGSMLPIMREARSSRVKREAPSSIPADHAAAASSPAAAPPTASLVVLPQEVPPHAAAASSPAPRLRQRRR